MDFSAAVTVATVGLNVSTLAASGAARIGLFDFDPTTGTATRLHDFGTVATPSTGDKTVTGLSAAVTVGRHWFGILLNATTGLTYHLPAHGLYRISSTSWGAGYNKGSVTYGTFASSYSTVTGTLNACPLLWAVLA
jgi:hypothetical protein